MAGVGYFAPLEPRLREWLEARFPEPAAASGAGSERVTAGDRRWRRRRLLLRLIPVVAILAAVAGFVVARASSAGHRRPQAEPPRAPVDSSVTLQVLLVVAWVLELGLEGYGLWRLRRALRPLRGTGEARVLRGLTRRQRRELLREVRGQAAVVPGDEPILDHLAKVMIANSWLALALAAMMLLLVTNLLTLTAQPPSQRALLLLAGTSTLVGGVLLLRDRQRATAYLAHGAQRSV